MKMNSLLSYICLVLEFLHSLMICAPYDKNTCIKKLHADALEKIFSSTKSADGEMISSKRREAMVASGTKSQEWKYTCPMGAIQYQRVHHPRPYCFIEYPFL